MARAAKRIPYVVDIQSDLLRHYGRRLVMPLANEGELPERDPILNPSFTVEDRPVVLLPLDAATVPTDVLGEPVGSLLDDGDRIIGALDRVVMRS
ncbi:MAG TPA: CcdB family protein [Alphaproteobacteria bacterium]|nr:CcdB family protein [Alphaproteobacteria bacterium]